MKHVTDLHRHTIASGHAYNTISEMVQGAVQAGLELYGITEHGPKIPGACHPIYFENFKVIDRSVYPIEVLFGAEVDILDTRGHLDLPTALMKKLDYCIASIHVPCYHAGTKEQNTEAYLHAMENPCIRIIGHPDDGRFPIDYYRLVRGAKETGTILEVNSTSLESWSPRPGAWDHYREMLNYCKEMQVPVVIDSDAHFYTYVGTHENAHKLMAEIGFPEELVLSASAEKVKQHLKK